MFIVNVVIKVSKVNYNSKPLVPYSVRYIFVCSLVPHSLWCEELVVN